MGWMCLDYLFILQPYYADRNYDKAGIKQFVVRTR